MIECYDWPIPNGHEVKMVREVAGDGGGQTAGMAESAAQDPGRVCPSSFQGIVIHG